MDTEYAIIGGGVVGLTIAYGLLLRGRRVVVLDEGDLAIRASRGNFGLIWVQGKGANYPDYARWTRRSASMWKGFAETLEGRTGVDLALQQDGGYVVHLDETDLQTEADELAGLRDALGGDYPFEIMDHAQLKAEEPEIGPKVAGALYCPEDGHVNPLRLLRALTQAVQELGGELRTKCRVTDVQATGDGFRLETQGGTVKASRVVLAAGLGAMDLASKLGFCTQVRPQQGQVLITEKLSKLMHRPNVEVRQVAEGGVQIGASHDDVGLNDREDVATVAGLARRAVDMFPRLARAKLVRSWAALRILTPDGVPVYQHSISHPGAFFVTCHSGITLAAVHAGPLCAWIDGANDAPDLTAFEEGRFDV